MTQVKEWNDDEARQTDSRKELIEPGKGKMTKGKERIEQRETENDSRK